MRPAGILGILLIVLGVVALVTNGFSFTKRETHDLGPVEITTTEKETIPIAPIIGGVAIVGGIVLLLTGSRRRVG